MGRINVAYAIFEGPSGPNKKRSQKFVRQHAQITTLMHGAVFVCSLSRRSVAKSAALHMPILYVAARKARGILAEGAIALSVTLSGGALFAS